MKKIIFIMILLFVSSCTRRTSHLSLYSNQDFDREHFTINTKEKGNYVSNNDTTVQIFLFGNGYKYPALYYGGPVFGDLNYTADELFKKSSSPILVDVTIVDKGLGVTNFMLPLVIEQTIDGYESNYK